MWEFSRDDAHCEKNPARIDLFLESYCAAGPIPLPDPDVLTKFIATRRLIEIQLDLFELRSGRMCDLDYCVRNVRYVRNMGLDAS